MLSMIQKIDSEEKGIYLIVEISKSRMIYLQKCYLLSCRLGFSNLTATVCFDVRDDGWHYQNP